MPVLTEQEAEECRKFRDKVIDKSLSHKIMSPVWQFLVDNLVPDDVPPNVLSLGALLCLLQASYLCYFHMGTHPQSVTFASALGIFAFWTLDAIDSLQAKRTGNDGPVVTLWDSLCSGVGAVFLPIIICFSFGIMRLSTIWYMIQVGQLVLLNKHLSAKLKDYMSYMFFNGPGEVLSYSSMLLLVRSYFGIDIFYRVYRTALTIMHQFATFEEPDWTKDFPAAIDDTCKACYAIVIVFTIVRLIRLPEEHMQTRNGIALCLLFRFTPIGFLSFLDVPMSLSQVICDGIFLVIVMGDLLVSKMAKRELHPWIVIFAMVSVLNTFAILLCFTFYFAKTFYEINKATRLPLLSINRNVYCDGVYDMCHLGHMLSFKKAAAHGTRLFVGVCSDEDVAAYKRAPVMTMEERMEIVKNCKYVYKCIPHAPCRKCVCDVPLAEKAGWDCKCGALTDKFIEEHNIHVVAHGVEYDTPTDVWYAAPRRRGMCRTISRCEGMSTSELIKRIQTRFQEEGEDKPKDAADPYKKKTA